MLNAARWVLDVEEFVHRVHVNLFKAFDALVVLGVLLRHGQRWLGLTKNGVHIKAVLANWFAMHSWGVAVLLLADLRFDWHNFFQNKKSPRRGSLKLL